MFNYKNNRSNNMKFIRRIKYALMKMSIFINVFKKKNKQKEEFLSYNYGN